MTPREWLAGLEFHGIKLGLDNIRFLLSRAGNPEAQFPTVHVAGSNGKGSVVAQLDAICRAAGYSTGRFTSPHLRRLNERFSLSGDPVDDDSLDAAIQRFRDIAGEMVTPPTYFEINTAVAFHVFAERHVDIGLIEVGLGGRFDSTNVIEPEASVITNIALEHTEYLGDTVEKIAFEKAGIIKPGRPVILGALQPEARETIVARAEELSCETIDALTPAQFQGSPSKPELSWHGERIQFDNATLSLPGKYQSVNAAVAVATAERLIDRYPRIEAETIVEGLRTARWPGRLDQVMDAPRIILDVSHNAAGMVELAATLNEQFVVVLAVAAGKDARSMIEALRPVCKFFVLTQFDHRRALPVKDLSAECSAEHTTTENVGEAIEKAILLAGDTSPLLVTGSFFTVGEAHEILETKHGARPLRF